MFWSQMLKLAVPSASAGLLYCYKEDFGGFWRQFELRTEALPTGENAEVEIDQNRPKIEVIDEFVEFLNRAVSPWHAVSECSSLLDKAGFHEQLESEKWDIKPMGKYYMKRNGSTIFAFAVGGKFEPGKGGMSIVAAHTDSPVLQIKPRSKLVSSSFLQVGVTPYAAGLWRTWFDRDLAIAGRVFVKVDEKIVAKLVHMDKPVLTIPSLCIHLDIDRAKFVFNAEDHLKPILATEAVDKLTSAAVKARDGEGAATTAPDDVDHHSALMRLIAREAGCNPSDILDFELRLLDAQPARITGLFGEFVSGGRLDNLIGAFTATTGLIESLLDDSSLANDPNIRLVILYDHEEVGSISAQGARSNLTEWVLRRLNHCQDDPVAFERVISRSLLISADQVHALHPNYKLKHEVNHSPRFHGGVLVSFNANQKFSTDAYSFAILQEVARKAGVPLQKYVVRNDSLCGSTIGPTVAANLAIPTVDCGTATLAMHSIREMADTTGIWHAQQLYKTFFESYPSVFATFDK